MPASLFVFLLCLGLAIAWFELRVIGGSVAIAEVRLEETISLPALEARRVLADWFRGQTNALGAELVEETSERVRFRWRAAGGGFGDVSFTAASGGQTKVVATLDLTERARGLARIARLLVAVIALPLGLGLPTLVHVLLLRDPSGHYTPILVALVFAIWPLFPVALLWQYARNVRVLAEGVIRSLPALSSS